MYRQCVRYAYVGISRSQNEKRVQLYASFSSNVFFCFTVNKTQNRIEQNRIEQIESITQRRPQPLIYSLFVLPIFTTVKISPLLQLGEKKTCITWNKWSCKLYLEGKVQLRHFYKKQIINQFLCSKILTMAQSLFPILKPVLPVRVNSPAFSLSV